VSSAKQILAMLYSRAEGDEEQFYSIALQVAASEARQGRRTTADAIRAAIEAARTKQENSPIAIPFSKPRGDLEGLIEFREPRYILKDVVLEKKTLTRLEDIVHQQFKRDWLREHGKVPSRRAIFIGPPGSGKTMTAEALAGQLQLPLFTIRLEALITRFMGETASKLHLVFNEISKRRGVYLFDEFDAIGGSRSATNDVAEMRRVLNSFLQYMEEENSTDSLIICATNHPELLDSALLRRFDAVLMFDMPSNDDIKRIIQTGLRPYSIGRLSWTKILPAAANLSQAEIAKAIEEAVKSTILNERNSVSTEEILKQLQERREMQVIFTKRASG
jgi:SpoVK/Ycf46/Vps4 family AAA+-type ATPase